MTKSDFLELAQSEKNKPKKQGSKKIDVKLNDWATLEWTCADSPTIAVDK